MYMKIIPKFKRWFSNKIVRIRLGFWFYISREVTRTYPGIVGHWMHCNINDVRIQSTLRCAMRGSRIFFRGVEVRHIFMFAGGYGPSHIFGNFIMQILKELNFPEFPPTHLSPSLDPPNVINCCSVGNFLHVFSIGQLKFKFHPIINRFIYHGSPLTIKNSIFQCVDKIIDRLLMIQTFVYTSHSIDMFE